ncbi:MAG: tRNA (adenosine(37)-N6)-dimethylallyltransferase MiaA [Desulfobacteraceae bacterium]|jgi:tRNA dimethylallyltransferase
MTNSKPKLIVITGPTASGKSSLAIELAVRLGGEIVNADSMQVYRGMDVGTAKPPIGVRRGIPHHLIDTVDPDETFNAAIYRNLALPAIQDIRKRKRVCFVVGGTGLYIKTLLGGLLKCPPADPVLREDLRRQCEEYGTLFLHKRLEKLDPGSARRIHPHDKIRIMRALEIIELTKTPLSVLTQKHGFKEKPFQTLKICLQMSREHLYDRINKRCLLMIDHGLVKETENLLSKGYAPELKPMKSLGYRHMIRYLEGRWGLDEAIHQLQTDTRRYAKRQLTWFRADPQMAWFEAEEKESIVCKIEEFMVSGENTEEGS